MKKVNVCKLLYILSALLVLGFAVAFGIDAYRYNKGGYLGSSPLDLYLLIRAIEFLIPAATVFTAAIICKSKLTGKKKK